MIAAEGAGLLLHFDPGLLGENGDHLGHIAKVITPPVGKGKLNLHLFRHVLCVCLRFRSRRRRGTSGGQNPCCNTCRTTQKISSIQLFPNRHRLLLLSESEELPPRQFWTGRITCVRSLPGIFSFRAGTGWITQVEMPIPSQFALSELTNALIRGPGSRGANHIN